MELFKGIEGSPITYLASDISAAQTTISVADDTALPPAPNICTIGFGENLETIKYGAKSNGVLQEVTRGIEGPSQSWQAGTEVARFFTAYDHMGIIDKFNNSLRLEEIALVGDMKVSNKIIQNNEDIKLDIEAIVYKTLDDVVRKLGYGIIVESGSNENGSYIKYGDGTMICTGSVSLNSANMVVGTLMDIPATFPQPFSSSPRVTYGFEFLGTNPNVISNYYLSKYPATTDSVTFKLVHAGWGSGRTSITIDYMAIGRWKETP